MKIVPFKKLVKKAAKELENYQQGSATPIKTGRPWLDDVFPVINKSVITIAAPSGVGKSTELQLLTKNIMDVSLNPDAEDYVFLNISLEMKVLSLVIRELSGKLNKSKRDVLLEEFSEEEKEAANDLLESLKSDKRMFINQTPITPTSFYEGCQKFLDAFKDKKSAFIAIDHLALINAGNGESKNAVIEHTIEHINNLKMEYDNVVFILLSQMNSDIQRRVAEKDRNSQPKDSDLYYSQFTFQVSDYVIAMINPFKLGLMEYSKLNPTKYGHLSRYIASADAKHRISLRTDNVLYYHILKMREAEAGYVDIYAVDMEPRGSQTYTPPEPKESDSTPRFDSTVESKNPNETDAFLSARGLGFEDEGEEDGPVF